MVDVDDLPEAAEAEREFEVFVAVEVGEAARLFDDRDLEELGLVSVRNAKATGAQPVPRFDRTVHEAPVVDPVTQRSDRGFRRPRNGRLQRLRVPGETIMSAWMTRTQDARSRTAR